MISGHLIGKLLFLGAVFLVLGAATGWRLRSSDRTAAVLMGLGLALITIKDVISVTSDTGEDLKLLGAGVIWLSFVVSFWRRKPSGTAA